MSNKRVSIVIPVFNREEYIAATLDSIFSQTFPDFEVITVDDGSTDKTLAILRQYASDSRLRIIESAHLGIARALNAGIESATTDLIARIDADDLMVPSRLERQYAFMNEHPELGGAATFYRIIDEFGKDCGPQKSPLLTIDEVGRFIASGSIPVFPSPTMMLRKSAILAVGGYRHEYRNCEDIDLFMRMIDRGYSIITQPDYLTHFRYHNRSESARNTRMQFHLNQLILENHKRRQHGEVELTVHDYEGSLKRLSLPTKLTIESRVQSALLNRRRDMAKLEGRTVAPLLLSAAAAILDPGGTIRKLKRFADRKKTALAGSTSLSRDNKF